MIIFNYLLKALGLLAVIVIGLFLLYMAARATAAGWEQGTTITRRRLKDDRHKNCKRSS
jgi:hypothetical protein